MAEIDPQLLTNENPAGLNLNSIGIKQRLLWALRRMLKRDKRILGAGLKVLPFGWPEEIRWLDCDPGIFVPKDDFQFRAYLLADCLITNGYGAISLLGEQRKRLNDGYSRLALTSYSDLKNKYASKDISKFRNEFRDDTMEVQIEKCLYVVGLAAEVYELSKWNRGHLHTAWEILSYARSLRESIIEKDESLQLRLSSQSKRSLDARKAADEKNKDNREDRSLFLELFAAMWLEDPSLHQSTIRNYVHETEYSEYAPETIEAWARNAKEEFKTKYGLVWRDGRPRKEDLKTMAYLEDLAIKARLRLKHSCS